MNMPSTASDIQVSDLQCLKSKVSHRRPHSRSRDGPFGLERGELSTRSREVEALQRHCGHGGSEVGPGQYEGAVAKDACLRNVRTGARIGSSCREPCMRQLRSPSLSKSLAEMNANPEREAVQTSTHCQGGKAVPDLPMLLPESSDSRQTQKQLSTPTTVSVGNAQHGADTASVAPLPRKRQGHSDADRSGSQECQASGKPKDSWKQRDGQHHHVPVPVSLSAEARKSRQPGNWNWHAVARPLCNTFTRQDGGCHKNARAQILSERWPINARVGHHHTAHMLHNAETRSRGWHETSYHAQDGPPHTTGSSVRSDSGRAPLDIERLVSKHDLQHHRLAAEAAAAALAVDLRRQQWQLQSALLPLMKQGIIDRPCNTETLP